MNDFSWTGELPHFNESAWVVCYLDTSDMTKHIGGGGELFDKDRPRFRQRKAGAELWMNSARQLVIYQTTFNPFI